MKKVAPVSRVFDGSYRITRTDDRLCIEVLDYHAGPLSLTAPQLEEFGLMMTLPSGTGAMHQSPTRRGPELGTQAPSKKDGP